MLGDGTIQTFDVDLPAARVDEREVATRPFGGVRDAIAGDARRVLYDRFAATKDAVDQRGLADVGAADDCKNGQAGRDVVRVRERRLAGQERQVLLVQVELVEVGAHETGASLGLFVAQFDRVRRGAGCVGDVVLGRVRVEFGGHVGLVVKVIHPPSLRRGAPQRPDGSLCGAPVHSFAAFIRASARRPRGPRRRRARRCIGGGSPGFPGTTRLPYP